MQKDLHELEEITFGIFSEQEIKDISVCEINNPKLCSSDKNTGYGTVYDPRLGTLENSKDCETCGEGIWNCPGHWSYIALNEPIVHPLFYKRVVDFLKCFCMKCYSLLITDEQILISEINKLKSTKRFDRILERIEKIDMCPKCSHPQPNIKYSTIDDSISMVYKQKDKGKISVVLPVDEIKKLFENVTDEQVTLLGFNCEFVHPKNLILSVFPVLPPPCRPYVIADGQLCDDDLTIQIVEIIKANNHLKSEDGTPISETKRQKYLQTLKFRITTFYNNSCLSPETPVLMWDGNIKRADEIKWGDELAGDDGEKRTVQFTCSGEDEMYEIIQENGNNYVVNQEHYITFQYSEHKNIIWVKGNKNSPDGSYLVKWFDLKSKKVKTKVVSVLKNRNKTEAYNIIKNFVKSIDSTDIFDIKVKDYLKFPKSYYKHIMGLKLDKPLNWEHKDVLLDPYLLGLWLGGGNSNGKSFTTENIELLYYWKNWSINNNTEIVLYPHKINKNINFKYHEYEISDPNIYRPHIHFGIKSINNTGYKRHNSSPLKFILNKYNLLNNKHIPDDFIYNSTDIRLKLLAGLIDTDGYVKKDGKSIIISQCELRKKLIEQIQFLAKSLGFYCNMKEIYKKNNNKTYKGYSVYISGNIDTIPTILAGKKYINNIKNGLRTNIKIKHLGKGKYNGFGVDKNNRFLLGDFTVTHNSGKAKHTTSGRPIKGLKERLTGKEGLIRMSLMGKICPSDTKSIASL